jgi:hypothetical protein
MQGYNNPHKFEDDDKYGMEYWIFTNPKTKEKIEFIIKKLNKIDKEEKEQAIIWKNKYPNWILEIREG